MERVFGFFITATIVLYLGAILIVYAFMPDPCGLLFDEHGKIYYSLSRNIFFYTSIFAFLLIQILMTAIEKSYFMKSHNDAKFIRIKIWYKGLRLAVNIFLILMLVFIGLANNAVNFSFESIHNIPYFASGIVLIWMLTFPVFLLAKDIN